MVGSEDQSLGYYERRDAAKAGEAAILERQDTTGRKFVVACILAPGARGYNPRRSEEIPPLYGDCTQYQKHYANDTEESERYGPFKKSKTHVAKLSALNPESVFGITSTSDKHPEE